MTHAFHISEETYQTLRILAQRQGRSPEDLFEDWVAAQRASGSHMPVEPLADRSLARFIGAFEAEVPDLVRHHDQYIAEAVSATHDTGGECLRRYLRLGRSTAPEHCRPPADGQCLC